RSDGIGTLARHDVRRLRRRLRAGDESQAGGRWLALVDVPAAMDCDVFHRQRPRAAVLHRAVLAARLRELHAGRCDATDLAGDLEWAGLPFVSGGAAFGQATDGLRELRPALEPLSDA